MLENMVLIMFDVNIQKLEENITSIKNQLIHQQNQFEQLIQIGLFLKHTAILLIVLEEVSVFFPKLI